MKRERFVVPVSLEAVSAATAAATTISAAVATTEATASAATATTISTTEAASAASTATTISAAESATTFARGAGGCFAYRQLTAVEVLAIEAFDSRSGFVCIVHGHKCEPTGATRFAICDDLQLRDCAELLKRILQVSLS